MSRLLVFGAGASRNYSQALHGITGLQMPLDSDFLKMTRKAILSHPANFGYPMSLDLDHLLRDLWELFRNKDLPSDEEPKGNL